MENKELFEKLIQVYSGKAYACYSDSAAVQAHEDAKWAAALAAQDVFTEEQVAAEHLARHNAWIASQQ